MRSACDASGWWIASLHVQRTPRPAFGAMRGRYWTKRNESTGLFMAQTKTAKQFKGVRRRAAGSRL